MKSAMNKSDLTEKGPNRSLQDLILILMVAIPVYVLASVYDLFEMLMAWTKTNESAVKEWVFILILLAPASAIFSIRRWIELKEENSERKRAAEALKYRGELEGLIMNISTHFINLAPDQIDHGIRHALDLIGKFASVDRSYLFLFSEDGRRMDNTHEWCAQGITSQIERLKGIDVDEAFPWFAKIIRRRETLYVRRVADLPPEADAERKEFHLEGIQSLLVVPMIYGSTLVGFLGFDSVRTEKSWAEDIVTLLKIAGEIFTNALKRKRVEEELRTSRESAQGLARENATVAEIGRIISSTLNIEEVYERFAKELGKLISFDRIVIDLNNPNNKTFTIAYVAGAEIIGRGAGDLFAISGSDNEYLIGSRSGLLVQPAGESDLVDRYPVLLPTFRAGFRSMMSVPLIASDQVIGGLHFRSFRREAYTDLDLKLAERVGTQIAGAIANAQLFAEHKRTEGALLVERQRFQTLAEDAPFGMVLIDPEDRFVYINPKFKELFGFSLRDIPDGRTWFRKAFPDRACRHQVVATWIQDLQGARAGEPRFRTFNATGADGGEKIINFISVQLATGEHLVTCEDVTQHKHAEEALQTSELQYRTTMDAMGDAVHMVDDQLRMILANKTLLQWNQRLGLETDILGKRFYDIFPFLPPKVQEEYHQVLINGQLLITEEETRIGGREIFTETRKIPILEEGKVVRIISVIRDITERKKAEEARVQSEAETKRVAQENATMAEIGRIISSTLHIEEVYERFAEEVRTLIPFDRIAINLIDLGSQAITVAYVLGIDVEGRRQGEVYPLEGSINEGVIQTRSGILIQNQEEDALKRFPALRSTFQAGIRSILTVPLISKDQVMGVLHFRSLQAGAYKEADVRLAERVGHQIAGAIANAELFVEQKRAEMELSIERARFQTLAEHAPFGMLMVDKAGAFRYVNPKFRELFGYDLEDVPDGRAWFRKAFPDPEYRQQVISQWLKDAEVLTSEEKKPQTFSVTCKDGTMKSVAFIPVLLETGEHLVTCEDVTDRLRTWEARRKRTEQIIHFQNALLDLGKMEFPDLDTALKRMTEVDSHMLGVERVSLWLYNRDRSEILCEDLYIQSRLFHDKGNRLQASDYPRYFQALQESRIIAAHEPIEDPRTNEFGEDYFKRYGITSMMDIPIRLHGEMVGILCHGHTGAKKEWTREEEEFAASIADLASLFLETFERKRTEEALRESEARYHSLFDGVPVGLYRSAPDGKMIDANRTFIQMLGYSDRESLLDMKADEFYVTSEDRIRWKTLLEREGILHHFEMQLRRRDGTPLWVEENARAYRGADGRILYYEGSIEDITEKKQATAEMLSLQEQLRQSQKMEAVGRLAGGIAHDFNNLLTVISGYSQLSLSTLQERDPLRENITEIQRATERAASLTRQLLAFSRRQILDMRLIDLNLIVQDLDKMLRRVIGEDIELATLLDKNLWTVRSDPSQIEQVILNLSVNARDAMPKGGKLTIETSNVHVDQERASAPMSVKPGPCVRLSITDTGVGMSLEVMERAFEPFFTTKEKGRGTGLGLSTVYGIVKQSGGDVWVHSEVGTGTTFEMFLPKAEETAGALKLSPPPPDRLQGSETILLVEDEASVRILTSKTLRSYGYHILEAANGEEAIRIVQADPAKIHLLLTDVVMPGMSGREVADRISPLFPEMKVLYISGYTDSAIVHHGVLDPGTTLLLKPFKPDTLAQKVRGVLDQSVKADKRR
jgi:PAS domain S-box-containing protein